MLEQHIAYPLRSGGPEIFSDSVGIGAYRIDLHPCVSGAGYLDIGCWPFQIPLGSMIPVRVENLPPGGKNLGVTHITNGAYRLHPVEWNIGESAGLLAVFCLERNTAPRAVRSDPRVLQDFQALLRREGSNSTGRRSPRCKEHSSWVSPHHCRLRSRDLTAA